MLIIFHTKEPIRSALKLDGDNAFVIKTTGYQDTTVFISYKKVLENVSLSVTNTEHKVNEDITVNIDDSNGDFLKYLSAVKISDGTTERPVLTKSAGGDSGNDWYEIGEDGKSLILKSGLFGHDGKYTVTLSAQYYQDQKVTFTVSKASEDPDAENAPEVASLKKNI